ncbi:MAG: chemotaxis protein CheD [Rhodospirillales bacterium]|nr:chemotaxis protein CheD [Rhodospirillales bacterium]MCB9964512.1 chemotaxis protein CheD [Rhodospirillales bacterium]MCB9973785.1 chemotaxis protein CheD [Rhodospirillales bacterium]MCB9980331.1 chemotaxis protein CheD [Rhodospirillales bacterium]
MTEERREHETYQSYFKGTYWQNMTFVRPGEFYRADQADELIIAETGSGIIVSIYDVDVHVGGLAHLILPKDLVRDFSKFQEKNADLISFARAPLDNLIKALKQKGAGKHRVKVRIYGGADLMEDSFDIGLKSAVFVQKDILEKGLKLITQDVGGSHCRRVHFFPYTGRLERYPMRRKQDREMLWAREKDYLNGVEEKFRGIK